MTTPQSDLALTHLRCFVAVVDAGSFAAAGRRLGLTTSAVSKALSRFEASYGVKLLHRSTHALSLTQDGAQLLEPARATLRHLGDFEQEMRGIATRGASGWVRISAPVGFSRQCLVPLLAPFSQQHPEIRLDLRANNQLVDLAATGVDLALRGGPLDDIPGHVAMHWFSVPWVLCATPEYVERKGMPRAPHELSRHDLIAFRNPNSGALQAWRFRDPRSRAALGVTLDPRMAFDDGESVWRAAATGMGIASAPHYLVADAIATGALVEILEPWRDVSSPISIIRRDTRLTPKRVRTVIAYLKRHAARFDCPSAVDTMEKQPR